MKKTIPIIEWQEDIQRTPKELAQYLSNEVENWGPERMLVLMWSEDEVQYIPASKERNFMNRDIFWDVTGWLKIWREDKERE